MSRKFLIFAGVLTVLIVAAFAGSDQIMKLFFRPNDTSTESGISGSDNTADIETVGQDITIPWGLAFLPDETGADGDLLITERTGTLKRIGKDKQSHTIAGVEPTSEGGLLGIALDPDFATNGRLYLYLTTSDSGALTNRIERYIYKDDSLSGRQVLFSGIPASSNHDGGRLAFGPDGFLYVTTGDAGNEANAQDRNSLAGKILRITADGAVAPGNPFGTAVYSYGHRNPQGLAWDGKGQLWSTEHGRSGTSTGLDELNLIQAGGNYGWPEIQGDDTRQGMIRPVAHSGATTTWAPAGLAYADGSLYFGGLRGQSLYQARIADDNTVTLKQHFSEEYGRLRTTAVRGDYLYMTTSNTDGRGNPGPEDDRIIKIKLSILK